MYSHVPLMKLFLASCSLVYPSTAKYDGLTCFCLESLYKAKSQVPLQGWNDLLLLQFILTSLCWMYYSGPPAFDLLFFSGPSVNMETYSLYWNETMLKCRIKLWHLQGDWRVSKTWQKIKLDMLFPLSLIYWLVLKSFIPKTEM